MQTFSCDVLLVPSLNTGIDTIATIFEVYCRCGTMQRTAWIVIWAIQQPYDGHNFVKNSVVDQREESVYLKKLHIYGDLN